MPDTNGDNEAVRDDSHDDDAPSDSKLIIEAARANNTDLLLQILKKYPNTEEAAKALNSAQTVLGNYAYHEAASRGNWDIIDLMLDQEGFECDPFTKDGDTPLHSVVRWINSLGKEKWEAAGGLVEMMLEAGSEPKLRNNAGLKPFDIVEPSNKELRRILEDAEYADTNRGDFVQNYDAGDFVDGNDEGAVGSNSDSDFDIEKKPAAK